MNRRLAQRGDLAELLVRRHQSTARPAVSPDLRSAGPAEPAAAGEVEADQPPDQPPDERPDERPDEAGQLGLAGGLRRADQPVLLADPRGEAPDPTLPAEPADPAVSVGRRRFGWRSVVALAAALLTIAATTAIALAPPVQDWVNEALDRGPAPAPSAPVTSTVQATPSGLESPPAQVAQAPTAALRVEVPAIGVKSDLDKLALGPGGVLQPPAKAARAGWYANGTVPGQPGPAVIAGHVDSRAGPGVFFKLRLLKPGAVVVVALNGGTSVRFRVTEVRTYPKDKFPTLEVYGPTPGPELRLITCGGDFDRRESSYLDNVVAFAVPV